MWRGLFLFVFACGGRVVESREDRRSVAPSEAAGSRAQAEERNARSQNEVSEQALLAIANGSVEAAKQECALGWRPDRRLEPGGAEMTGIWLPCAGMDRLVALEPDGTCVDLSMAGETLAHCTWKGTVQIIGDSTMHSGAAYGGRESSSIGIYVGASGKVDVFARVR